MKLYGIGVGPGDPELLTRKAERILRRIPILFAPTMSNQGQSRAYQVVKDLISSTTQVIPLQFPHFNSEDFEQSLDQVVDTIINALHTTEEAAFIVIGDITLYSSYFQVAPKLKQRVKNLETELIPGLSAHQAAAASCEVPLVQENERLLISSGYDMPHGRKQWDDAIDTVVVYKACYGENLARFLEQNPRYGYRKLCHCLGLSAQTIYDMNDHIPLTREYFTLALFKK